MSCASLSPRIRILILLLPITAICGIELRAQVPIIEAAAPLFEAEEEEPSTPFYRPAAIERVIQPAPEVVPLAIASQSATTGRMTGLFGTGTNVNSSLLSQSQRAGAAAPGSDIVLGLEGVFRSTTDGGSLLGKSRSTKGVAVQTRTPIMTDPRVRGDRAGRLTASGSYWLPARQDLDTALSKIDSRIIQDMVVVKGPYSVRYGPGFDFVDFQLMPAPRYDGFQQYGHTTFEYKTNGEQIYGRTSLWGGSNDWGYRIGYGHRIGNDYRTGGNAGAANVQITGGGATRLQSRATMPSSYNSRDLDVALGFDLTRDSRVEVTYLRQDQSGVEFPGLVFDINDLAMDGIEVKFIAENQPGVDLLTVEGWYNDTRFRGDTFGIGKNVQMPTLGISLQPFGAGGTGKAITDVDSLSTGARIAGTWGEEGFGQVTLGSDAIIVNQQLNDIEDPFDQFIVPAFTPINQPIPRSSQNDIGFFLDAALPVSNRLTLNAGTRVDFIDSDARNGAPNLKNLLVPPPPFTPPADTSVSALLDSGLDQSFTLWSIFATAEFEANDVWTWTTGVGYGQRAPTLTELYSSGAFIGSLQPGLTRLTGDPQLRPERRLQFDLGFEADYGNARIGMNGFHAWVHDYITYDHGDGLPSVGGLYVPGFSFQRLFYTNTDLATLAGFEAFGDFTLSDRMDLFAVVSYVEGRDHTRATPARLAVPYRIAAGLSATGERSRSGNTSEALPGLPPMEATIGLRIHEASRNPLWGIEPSVRIVDGQNRVADTLAEFRTGGFTIWNIRAFAQLTERTLFIMGVENLGDVFYREHLDYRAGVGVYQPGANWYFATQCTY